MDIGLTKEWYIHAVGHFYLLIAVKRVGMQVCALRRNKDRKVVLDGSEKDDRRLCRTVMFCAGKSMSTKKNNLRDPRSCDQRTNGCDFRGECIMNWDVASNKLLAVWPLIIPAVKCCTRNSLARAVERTRGRKLMPIISSNCTTEWSSYYYQSAFFPGTRQGIYPVL